MAGGASGPHHNVKCSECGDLIRTYYGPVGLSVVCAGCLSPLSASCGTPTDAHWDDDPTGASGSWDNNVRMHEGD